MRHSRSAACPKMHLLSVASLLICALPSQGSANPFAARQVPEETNAKAPAVPRSFIIEFAAVSPGPSPSVRQ